MLFRRIFSASKSSILHFQYKRYKSTSWYWPFSSVSHADSHISGSTHSSIPLVNSTPAILSNQEFAEIPGIQPQTPFHTEEKLIAPIEPSPIPDHAAPDSIILSEADLKDLPLINEPLFPGIWEIDQYGLGGYGLRASIEYAVEALHASVGLPWFLAIPTGVVLLRICFFPAVIMSIRSQINMSYIQKELTELRTKMQHYIAQQQRSAALQTNHELKTLMKQHQVYPFRPALILFCQMPFLYCYFMAMNDMAHAGMASLMSGGLLWFQNLCLPDPYFILPILNASLMLSGVQLMSRLNPMMHQGQPGIYKPLVILFALLSIPFSYLLPCTVQLYILAQTGLHVVTQGMFLSKRVRLAFAIKDPKMPPSYKPSNLLDDLRSGFEFVKKFALLNQKKPLVRRID